MGMIEEKEKDKDKDQKTIKILVLGGYGRVGGSTVRSLSSLFDADENIPKNNDKAVEISVGGKSYENFLSAKERWTNLVPQESIKKKERDNMRKEKDSTFSDVKFTEIDYRDEEKLKQILCTNERPNFDLVVNTAGPFQQLKDPIVLRSCIDLGINYMDVCD